MPTLMRKHEFTFFMIWKIRGHQICGLVSGELVDQILQMEEKDK